MRARFLVPTGGQDTGAELDPESTSREGGQSVGSEATGEAEYTPLLWDADRLEVVPQSAIRKRVVWSGDADFENTFEAALPCGNIALAASTGGWVHIYTSWQGPDSAQYVEYPLKGAHGVLWDPQLQLLWALGDTTWHPSTGRPDGSG